MERKHTHTPVGETTVHTLTPAQAGASVQAISIAQRVLSLDAFRSVLDNLAEDFDQRSLCAVIARAIDPELDPITPDMF